MPAQIQALFCQHFNCPPSDYEARLFRQSLYWHARLLAPLARAFKPDFFAEDFKFIRHLGTSADAQEMDVDLFNFRDTNLAKSNFWRTALRIRVSGRKAGRIGSMLLAKERATELAGSAAR